MNPLDVPSLIVACVDCNEDVQVFGALSLVREPFRCVACLDPRHAALEDKPAYEGPNRYLESDADQLALA